MPYSNRDPKRDHNFDNHPHPYIIPISPLFYLPSVVQILRFARQYAWPPNKQCMCSAPSSGAGCRIEGAGLTGLIGLIIGFIGFKDSSHNLGKEDYTMIPVLCFYLPWIQAGTLSSRRLLPSSLQGDLLTFERCMISLLF